MKTQNPASDQLSENLNTLTKMFLETSNAMAEIYSKQFELGANLLNRTIRPGSESDRFQPIYNASLFHSGFELMKRNMEDLLELSRKNLPLWMNMFGIPAQSGGNTFTERIMEAYNYQTKQMIDANKRFLEGFADTFKLNGEQDRIFNSFQRNSERNFKMAEEGIRNALKTYSSITDKSSKEMKDLSDEITKQIESLTNSNMKLWMDLLESTGKETEGEETRRREKVRK